MQVGEITFSNVVCVLKVCILMLVIKTKAERNRVYNIYMNTTNQILQIDLSILNTTMCTFKNKLVITTNVI